MVSLTCLEPDSNRNKVAKGKCLVRTVRNKGSFLPFVCDNRLIYWLT